MLTMTSYIIRRLLLDHPDGLLRDLVPLLPLLHAPGRPGDPHRRRRRPEPRPDPGRADQRALRASTTRCSCSSSTTGSARLHWDLGESFQNGRSVNDILGEQGRQQPPPGDLGRSSSRSSSASASGCSRRIRRYSFADGSPRSSPPAASAIPVFVLGLHPPVRLRGRARTSRTGPSGCSSAHLAASAPTPGPSSSSPTGEQWRYLILPADHPRLRVHRARRPHDPRLDARGDAGRLHAHGARPRA